MKELGRFDERTDCCAENASEAIGSSGKTSRSKQTLDLLGGRSLIVQSGNSDRSAQREKTEAFCIETELFSTSCRDGGVF